MSAKITGDSIIITGRGDKPLATIALAFSVGTSRYRVTAVKPSELGFVGHTNDPSVRVSIMPADCGYVVELCGNFNGTDTVVYFAGSTVESVYGRAFVPDADCRVFVTRDKEEFYLTNSGMILQNKVNKQDLWMIAPPPHVISFGDDNLGWFGLSIPEPMPVSYTKISCADRKVSVTFDNYSPGHDSGRMPRVFIDCDLADGKAILDRHCEHAEDLGLVTADKTTYSWWYNPIYCTWGDQCYLQKTAPRVLADSVAAPMDEELLMRWADGIRAIYPGEVNYIIDAGWFSYLGDYEPYSTEFKSVENFQSVIAKLKAKGFRVILWYTPFWVQPGANVERDHPEYLIRRRDGAVYRDQDKRGMLDFSRPDVREYTRGRIEFLLTTLGADGFKIDMNYVHPLMSDITLFDSGWGHGNLLWRNVARFIHDCATAIKADAFFTVSGIESYLQPYAASVRLNDLFDFDHAKAWYDRAEMVTRLMPGVPIDVDGWPASIEKLTEYWFVSPVFGPPVTYYIEAIDIKTVKLTEGDHNRMASVWHVYSQAPCEHGMQVTIDAETGVFERRNAAGVLTATALDRGVLVSYSGNKIFLTSNADRCVRIPAPSDAGYSSAEMVMRDGRREPVSLFRDNAFLLLNARDSGAGILCYEIS